MKNQKENKEKPVIVLSFDGTVGSLGVIKNIEF